MRLKRNNRRAIATALGLFLFVFAALEGFSQLPGAEPPEPEPEPGGASGIEKVLSPRGTDSGTVTEEGPKIRTFPNLFEGEGSGPPVIGPSAPVGEGPSAKVLEDSVSFQLGELQRAMADTQNLLEELNQATKSNSSVLSTVMEQEDRVEIGQPGETPSADGAGASAEGMNAIWVLVVAIVLSVILASLIWVYVSTSQKTNQLLKNGFNRILEGIGEIRISQENQVAAAQETVPVQSQSESVSEPDAAQDLAVRITQEFYSDPELVQKVCPVFSAYLDFLGDIRQRLTQCYQELDENDKTEHESFLMGRLLSDFAVRRESNHEAAWREMLRTADQTGIFFRADVVRRLKAAQSEDERSEVLMKLFYRDILESEVYSHLILIEETRNLDKFYPQPEVSSQSSPIIARAKGMLTEFLETTTQLTGHKIHYVPLFSDMDEEKHAHFLRNNSRELMRPSYRRIELPRRKITAVLSYGFAKQRGWETEETQVIIS